jgi:hypothetical protein
VFIPDITKSRQEPSVGSSSLICAASADLKSPLFASSSLTVCKLLHIAIITWLKLMKRLLPCLLKDFSFYSKLF